MEQLCDSVMAVAEDHVRAQLARGWTQQLRSSSPCVWIMQMLRLQGLLSAVSQRRRCPGPGSPTRAATSRGCTRRRCPSLLAIHLLAYPESCR